MNSPLFSIITVTYNASSTIAPTLKSVDEQSYTHYEHLIIDGSSKDDTLALIASQPNERRRVFSESDKGLYDAMNKGIDRAQGEYLIFLNAGDAFHAPDLLQKLADCIVCNHAPDILYGETALVDSERNFVAMRRLKTPERLSWRSFRNGMLVCHQAFIVRRELAPHYDLNYRFSADFDWCIRCMQQTDRICNTHALLIDYLSEGLTTQNHKASLKERYRIMCRYYGRIPVATMHLWFAVRYYYSKWVKGQV